MFNHSDCCPCKCNPWRIGESGQDGESERRESDRVFSEWGECVIFFCFRFIYLCNDTALSASYYKLCMNALVKKFHQYSWKHYLFEWQQIKCNARLEDFSRFVHFVDERNETCGDLKQAPGRNRNGEVTPPVLWSQNIGTKTFVHCTPQHTDQSGTGLGFRGSAVV